MISQKLDFSLLYNIVLHLLPDPSHWFLYSFNILFTFFPAQREDNRCKHGKNAQDDRRLEKAEKGDKAEATRGENQSGQNAGRGERAIRLCNGPPQRQVQRDGRRNRERGEEEEKTSETQEERGRAGVSGSRIQPVTLREQGLLYTATVPYCKIGFFVHVIMILSLFDLNKSITH